MLLRPRQKELVDRAVEALLEHGNTLAVAPTGSGKTIMLSAVIGEMFKGTRAKDTGTGASPMKVCVIAHRDELTAQNEAKFCRVNPHLPTSIFDASTKSWQGTVAPLAKGAPLTRIDLRGTTTFAMIQTLSRDNNLASMPPLDLLVIDEAHHARATSYLKVIDYAKALNPDLKLLGMTATPNRGDKKGLRPIFSNVCDQISVKELITSGYLVRPKTFVMDVGAQEDLKQVKKLAGDYSMEEVARIMNTYPINRAVVAHWKEKAGDRRTVVFCSTLDHARHVRDGFCEAGVSAVLIHGEMSDAEREQTLKAYTTGQAQVIVNVAVLTEGWDDPLTSCVVLLRPSSYKSTFIQMIGRGLRVVNSEEYPGVVKNDCVVLDFGTATLAHGALEQAVDLEDHIPAEGEAPTKRCLDCEAEVPARASECSLCGFVFESQGQSAKKLEEKDFTMREVDVFNRPDFVWVDIDDRQSSFMASGMNAWGGVFFRNGKWCALGALKRQPPRILAVGEKPVCFAAANDWMNLNESDETARKVKGWLKINATYKQLKWLPEHQNNYDLTCYKAMILMALKFNTTAIKTALQNGGII